jgi:hypothetical protein
MASIKIKNTDVKITDVLKLIADGVTYEKIATQLKITISDIFLSANVAHNLITKVITINGDVTVEESKSFKVCKGTLQTIDEIQKVHPNAFKKWDDKQDYQLTSLFKAGDSIMEIAKKMMRTKG